MKNYKLGDFFKKVTGMKRIPEDTEAIWDAVKKATDPNNAHEVKNNLVPVRDVFPIDKTIDMKEIEKQMDKALKIKI